MPEPTPFERTTYTFGPHKEYTVKRYTSGEERKIMQGYAKSLAAAGPEVRATLESLDGGMLYMHAILTECLIDAPAHWWQEARITFDYVYPEEMDFVTREVNAWLNSFRLQNAAGDLAGGDAATDALAPAETVPAAFTGRAS